MTGVDLAKLRRLAARMNRYEADWLMGTIRYAIEAGLDPLDVIAGGSRDGKIVDERAQAFARHLNARELEWYAENGGDLYTEIKRERKREDGRAPRA
jgi:hypothetical protein